MTSADSSRVVVDPTICGGRPNIAGSRVRATDVLEMIAGGASAHQITTDFPYLAAADIEAALAYALRQRSHKND